MRGLRHSRDISLQRINDPAANPQLLDATALKAARVVDEKGVLDGLIPGRIRIDLFLLSARFMGEVIPRTL